MIAADKHLRQREYVFAAVHHRLQEYICLYYKCTLHTAGICLFAADTHHRLQEYVCVCCSASYTAVMSVCAADTHYRLQEYVCVCYRYTQNAGICVCYKYTQTARICLCLLKIHIIDCRNMSVFTKASHHRLQEYVCVCYRYTETAGICFCLLQVHVIDCRNMSMSATVHYRLQEYVYVCCSTSWTAEICLCFIQMHFIGCTQKLPVLLQVYIHCRNMSPFAADTLHRLQEDVRVSLRHRLQEYVCVCC